MLAQALNAAHASGDLQSELAVSDRFLAVLDAPSGAGGNLGSSGTAQTARRGQVLVLRTQALLGLGRLPDAAHAADRAMAASPSADAFVLQVCFSAPSIYCPLFFL